MGQPRYPHGSSRRPRARPPVGLGPAAISAAMSGAVSASSAGPMRPATPEARERLNQVASPTVPASTKRSIPPQCSARMPTRPFGQCRPGMVRVVDDHHQRLPQRHGRLGDPLNRGFEFRSGSGNRAPMASESRTSVSGAIRCRALMSPVQKLFVAAGVAGVNVSQALGPVACCNPGSERRGLCVPRGCRHEGDGVARTTNRRAVFSIRGLRIKVLVRGAETRNHGWGAHSVIGDPSMGQILQGKHSIVREVAS